MFDSRKIAVCLALLVGMALTNAQAREQSLKFRLVVHDDAAMKVVEAPDGDGHRLGSGSQYGTATFEDGRIAAKYFVFSFEETKAGSQYIGYSTYTFEDGSSITARFDDTTGADGVTNGKYTVLGGSGEYDGAKGSGWYQSVKNAWPKSWLFNGGFDLTLP